MSLLTTPTKYYKSRHADDRQKELYTKFPTNSFLGNEKNVDHVLRWNTFFRRNLHRLAIDYLGINLHPYQAFILYMMGICPFVVIIACRAAAKSFIIALYACCRCIAYPHSKIVLSSATKGQSKLIISEKIRNELMNMSPVLRKEISRIKDNQNEVIVYFRSGSTIVVVPASENGRGHRSNVVVREEFRQIEKNVDDSILSPFQTIRQPPYIIDPYYAKVKELQEEPVDIYISSSWLDPHWMWQIVDNAYDSMLKDPNSACLLAFDESITLKHNIRTQKQMQKEKKKQDPITWQLEFLNLRLKENQSAFFTYAMLLQNQQIKRPFYPRSTIDVLSNKKNPYDIPKQNKEIRVVSCDMAFIENKKNDNSSVDKGTIIRTATLILAIVNQVIAVIGASSFASAAWYQILSIVATIVAALVSAWENNDWTYFAKLGTGVLDALEDGKITVDEVQELLDKNKEETAETK